MKKLVYQTNDYCWAIYLDGKLLVWGQHGDDPTFALRSAGSALGFSVENGTLPALDGGEPPTTI